MSSKTVDCYTREATKTAASPRIKGSVNSVAQNVTYLIDLNPMAEVLSTVDGAQYNYFNHWGLGARPKEHDKKSEVWVERPKEDYGDNFNSVLFHLENRFKKVFSFFTIRQSKKIVSKIFYRES